MQKQFIALLFLLLPLAVSAADESTVQLIEKGNERWSQHQFEEAESLFKKALQADPQSALAHSRLGALYLTTNRVELAVPQFQQAIMLDAENPQLYMLLSVAYVHQAHYEMADAMAREALRLDPEMKNAKKMREYLEAKNTSTAKAEPKAGTGSETGTP